MNISQETFDFLESEIEGIQTYSGRGMFGAECVGIVSSDPWEVIRQLREAEENWMDTEGENIETIRYLIDTSPSTDNMGFDTIFYWEGLRVE